MREGVRCVAAAAAVGLLLGAFADGAQAQTIGEDSAVGDVITEQARPIGFAFDARSGPSGEHPSGSALFQDRVDFDAGPVTCLTVNGNRATIGFDLRESGFPTVKGAFFFVEDNGTPGVGRDHAFMQAVLDAPPTVCPPNTFVYRPLDTVTSGELTVHDAPAFPTSKAQCKDGGWQNFGTAFKNQGDCVSFVATKGKTPPGGH